MTTKNDVARMQSGAGVDSRQEPGLHPGYAIGRRSLLLAASALALPAWAQLAVPPLAMTQRTLANGLQVIASPDPRAATVSVQVWYRVGGKDDPVGRSGFAHLFEHMMFKATKHMKAEQFDRLTEDVGGMNNAFTAEDMTGYEALVPSNHLERILWAEAERMSSLTVDQANFDSERLVVQEEFRQRVLAEPYGLLFNAMASEGFERHPYRRPVIGSIEDLNAATLDDVRHFHATYYRPDNAVLIVTGGFEPKQLDAWVDRYFGSLQRPATPIPRVNVAEPRLARDRVVALSGANVPLPAALLIWQAPKVASPDTKALRVAQALLSAGESSRLNEALVYRQNIAQSAGFEAAQYADAGLLIAFAIAAGKQRAEHLVAPLMHEITRLAQGPISAAELDKVKTGLLTAALVARETPQGRAAAIGQAVVLQGDANAVNRELSELQAVTAADVQSVLKTYVLDARRVTIHYTQEQTKKKGAKS